MERNCHLPSGTLAPQHVQLGSAWYIMFAEDATNGGMIMSNWDVPNSRTSKDDP